MSLYKRLHEDNPGDGFIGFASADEAEAFRLRPIINRFSRINGGVFYGRYFEADVVVDDQEQPMLKQTYEMLKTKLIREHVPRYDRAIINGEVRHKPATTFDPMSAAIEAYYYTQVLIPTNQELAATLAGDGSDNRKREVALTATYGQGGASSHQALNSAYFIEKMIDEGLLTGSVHVEEEGTVRGTTEAWVRYIPEYAEDIIIDTTLGFVGPLSVGEQLPAR